MQNCSDMRSSTGNPSDIQNRIASQSPAQNRAEPTQPPMRKHRNPEGEFADSLLQNRVVLSIGTKGSGKSFLMLNFLRFALKYKLYERYILVLPAYKFEQNDSYSFIDDKDPDIFIFEGYNEVIIAQLMEQQKNEKTQKKTLCIVDDASGENVWRIDPSMQKMITVVRHLNITIWLIIHSATGVLSSFIRQQCDVLLLSKMTNAKLLENIWEEFLSLTYEYQGREGHKKFYNDFIKMHEQKYQVLYLDLRKNIVCFDAGSFTFKPKKSVRMKVEEDAK